MQNSPIARRDLATLQMRLVRIGLSLRCASLLDGCGQAAASATVLTRASSHFRLPRTTHGRGLYLQKDFCVITGEDS